MKTSRSRVAFALVAAVLGVASVGRGQGVASNVDFPRYPAISADGKKVSFSWRGDVWVVPAAGGEAERITSNPADELFSAFSPDGKKLAITSNRFGGSNLFTVNLDGTGLTQVTFTDRPMVLTQWGKDDKGAEKLFVSAAPEPQAFPAAHGYEVSPDGGDITPVFTAVGTSVYASPNGKRVLFTRGNNPWVRRGYRGADGRELWMYDRETKKFTRLTEFTGNDGKGKWLDDETVAFLSEREGNTLNLFTLKVGEADGTARAITHFTDDNIDDFDVSPATKQIVFAKWNKLYTVKPGGEPQAIAIRGNEEEGDRYRFQQTTGTVSDAALSPDGKTMASIAYGEVYVRGADSKAPSRRVSLGMDGRKREIAWSADGSKLYFVCDVTGKEELYVATVRETRTEVRQKMGDIPARAGEVGPGTRPATEPAVNPPKTPEDSEIQDQVRRRPPGGAPGAPGAAEGAAPAPSAAASTGMELSRWGDAISFEVKKLWDSPSWDHAPTPSPDGKVLAYVRDRGHLMIHDETTGTERMLVEAFDSIDYRFSPDSRYIAYATEDRNNNSDIWIVPVDGSEKPINVTRHPNNDGAPRWSADGKILTFLSNRTGIGEETAVYQVYLDKSLETLAAPELDAYYRDAAMAARRRTPPSTQPTTGPARGRRPSTRPGLKKADLEDAYLRIRRLTNIRGSISDVEVSPAADRIYFVGYLGSQRGLLSQSREVAEPTRIAAAGNITSMSLAGDSLTLVESGLTGGRAALVKLPGGETEYYDPADRLKVSLAKLSEQKFLEAARVLEHVFYNGKMNGTDWPALTKKYLELAKASRTPEEFDFMANKLLGELNGSHLGINAPGATPTLSQSVGYLGIKAARVEGGMRVEDVTVDGPGDKGKMALKKGDVLLSVDGEKIGPKDTMEKMLVGKSGSECVVGVRRDGKEIELLITPTSFLRLSDMAYDKWRFDTNAKVEKLSGGKLGYIHIHSMDQASLETYKRDLYAACEGRQGMLIDVRWNGGGSTADLLLASIMSPYHAYTIPRDAPMVTDSYPTDRLYIPRFIGPINMLCNERSFSNAEITAHAFKTLKRGTLVGNQTAGGVISTGGVTLLDGTTVRTPGRGWYTLDGKNMELNGAMPDILVVQTPDDEVADDDRQLKAAVEDLMKRVK